MDKKRIGFKIELKEGEKIVCLKTTDSFKKYIKKLTGEKNSTDYIKEFLVTQKNFDIVNKAYINAKLKAIPDDIKDKNDQRLLLCDLQMQTTYSMAATEFVNIVLMHKPIYDNKKYLLELTKNFFTCFHFIKGEGMLFFDLDQLCRYTLEAGFSSISQEFAKSETLNTLKIINGVLDNLEQEELQNKVLGKEDENYLDLQKEFYEKKQRFYKERLLIEKEEKVSNGKRKATKKKKITIPQYALYYYYLQVAKEHPHFENHLGGKVEAIKELIEKEKIDTTFKYFQIKYNFISHSNTNRVAKNQVANISYVANEMLKDFPEAQKIALEELQLAQKKDR